ncbi:response regulator [Pseudobacteriovorax antillogorgiicola]|uniref:Response regulator receiver domain-containing protein n=1 Tax=Pseudobacteriovorax antillogorgiicola TaxID=1513793 RepID=A0A1Y6CWV4_9BACT|nr:response regulator [Pseudobacteriovorax antillogorgiicola]TCS44241.1 response regulator receiver domain-containing protein [Pseudobacteriovorax antillogorgiicola]SMF80688.1 Response regulator receiver domain-containing protein [Pseudobacteriovorax antillogorgiicola]
MNFLVVDDDEEVALVISEMFRDLGHDTYIVATGMEAIQVLGDESCFFTVDAVYTDIMMLEMNGIDLAHEIVAIDPHMPVIAVSGASLESIEKFELNNDLFFHLLRKPLSESDLKTSIQKLVAFYPLTQKKDKR